VVVAIELQAVRAELQESGFAVGSGTLREVEFAAQIEGIRLTGMGPGRNLPKKLRPFKPEDAPPRSLSAVFGLGPQPLHSDGAHMQQPPDIVVLHSELPAATGTAIRRVGRNGQLFDVPDAVRHGVFTVRGNGIAFLTRAYVDGRFRFDPVTMTPGDQMAREAVAWFRDQRAEALVHYWTEPNQILFIDNRVTLHAREAVVEGDEPRELGRLYLNCAEDS
jgi:hypothetical protein